MLEAAAEFAGYAPSGETPKTRKARKRRKAEQTDKAREEARQKAEETAMLVLALRGLAQPVAGSPAQAWLASRRITAWPGTGLGFLPALDNTLPDPLRLQIYSPEYPALVVWACADDGTITGGQRILLDDAGKAAQTDPGKPSFGLLSGCPARFPARDGTGDGPLLVAEGPETALTLWLATGYESRAVFGVSGWKTAPLPTDREILLAPDRDAAPSPAGIAFRKAVAHHLARGCRLRIAPAPEPKAARKTSTTPRWNRASTPFVPRSGPPIPPARTICPTICPTRHMPRRPKTGRPVNRSLRPVRPGRAGTGRRQRR